MAFRLSKTQAKDLARHRHDAERARKDVEAELHECNEAVRIAVAALNRSVARYNAVAAVARTFVDGVAQEHRDAYDERTENWRDGEAGQAADSWISEWEGVAALHDLEEASLPELVRGDLTTVKQWADQELADLPEEAQ